MAQNPVITIEMENGDIIKAELYPEIAPNTVNNFISTGKWRESVLRRDNRTAESLIEHKKGGFPDKRKSPF